MKLKGNSGIGLTDAIIAISIFVIFSAVIISISYNIYIQSNFVKRNNTATNYIVNLFEYAKAQNIEEVNNNLLSEYATVNFGDNINITNIEPEQNSINYGYTIFILVNDMHNDNLVEYDENIVKQISITVYYKLGGKVKNTSMSTLISK